MGSDRFRLADDGGGAAQGASTPEPGAGEPPNPDERYSGGTPTRTPVARAQPVGRSQRDEYGADGRAQVRLPRLAPSPRPCWSNGRQGGEAGGEGQGGQGRSDRCKGFAIEESNLQVEGS